ncbi:MAG: DUF1801 domain-containing protein [Melioribacteraceae bacterium]|nr:DUF1801 domain-containing protein [Melioribacteraceae bacterium]
MAKAELKTKPTSADVEKFLNSIENEKRKKDAFVILDVMKKVTKEEPKMWGASIIGFGLYHYKYESGREGDWFLAGFSPRKTNFSIYIMSGFKEFDELLSKLGKHKTGSSCLYINKLEDVDLSILKKMVTLSVKKMKSK